MMQYTKTLTLIMDRQEKKLSQIGLQYETWYIFETDFIIIFFRQNSVKYVCKNERKMVFLRLSFNEKNNLKSVSKCFIFSEI